MQGLSPEDNCLQLRSYEQSVHDGESGEFAVADFVKHSITTQDESMNGVWKGTYNRSEMQIMTSPVAWMNVPTKVRRRNRHSVVGRHRGRPVGKDERRQTFFEMTTVFYPPDFTDERIRDLETFLARR